MTGMIRFARPSSQKWRTSSSTKLLPSALGFAEFGEHTTIRYRELSSSAWRPSTSTSTPRSVASRNTGAIRFGRGFCASLRTTAGSL